MARSERDIIDAHITDPTATAVAIGDLNAVQNTGWGATAEADFDKIWTEFDKLIADVASNNSRIDAILVALEEVGIVAKS